MANINHSSRTDPELHEPKGVATAANGTVYKATGTGSGVWSASDVDTGWNDLKSPLVSAKLTGNNQPTWTQVIDNGSGSTGVFAHGFSATVLNELWISMHMPHDYQPGTNIFPHVHWLPSTTDTGTVRWGLEFSCAKGHDQEAYPTTTTIFLEQVAAGTALFHQLIEVPDPGLNIGIEPDAIILVRLFRDAAHANDTFTGVALGLELDAHYQSDRHNTLNKEPDFYV